MEQRGVIVTAVVLALILAGALWYSLTREITPTTSPTPSPIATGLDAEPTEVPVTEVTPTPATGAVLPAETTQPQPVPTTARSGATEYILVGLAFVTLASAWQLKRVAQNITTI